MFFPTLYIIRLVLAAVPAVRKSTPAMFGLNTVEANELTFAMVLLAMGMAPKLNAQAMLIFWRGYGWY